MMTKQEARILYFFIGIFALTAFVAQLVVIPRAAAAYASRYPEVAYLEPLYVTGLTVALIGIELALLSAWNLVSAATTAKSVSQRSTRWTNIMTASLIFVAFVLAAICVHAGSVVGVGGPAMLFGLVGCLVVLPMAFALKSWIRAWFGDDNVYALTPTT